MSSAPNIRFAWYRYILFFLFAFAIGATLPGQPARTAVRAHTEALNVYPNPSVGKFTIEVREQDNQFDINIYNLMGEMVFHWESADQAAATLEVDLARRPDGVYFVELDTDKASVLKRIVLKREH